MLTLDQIRRLLGEEYDVSDEELAALRRQLYEIAWIALDESNPNQSPQPVVRE